MRVLEGIRVVDLTNLLPGPFATNILAELGAEVVKVERPDGGDPVRQMIPGLYETLNSRKESLTLDLKNEEDKGVLRELLQGSDVLIEGFRPGVMDRLGFSKNEVAKLNPDLIYCSISGYGQSGPYRDVPGHDLNYLAVSGVLGISGQPNGGPEAAGGIQIADLAASLYATISVLGALLNKARSHSSGVYIDVSLVESALALMSPRIVEYYARNEPRKSDFMGRGAYGTYLTKDGQYISIACVEEKFWETFCETVGMKEFMLDNLFNSWTKRMEKAEIINRRIETIIVKKTLSEWLSIFGEVDLPVSRVNTINDLSKDPHLKYRNAISIEGERVEIPFPAKMIPMEGLSQN
ncbi:MULTISPECIES: CaiB/BaiF CoA-transferase family protein [Sporosarcina]|uniref:CaiB/BaiF CoA transferase family protein n=1 Tax=Sporosarcina TaxID=1569 RepID=UPI0013040AC1|nr:MULTISPECIES: CaiB/BaiF CoA-transferase family protein [Sporosarcina]